jgi:hypothetical protein
MVPGTNADLSDINGEVPEWPKGTGCKPVGVAYGGSNPPLSTMENVVGDFVDSARSRKETSVI